MKYLCVILLAIGCVSGNDKKPKTSLDCHLPQADMDTSWIDMVSPCIDSLTKQVNVEIGAAMTYLAMGAHFARDTVNRPGFAKFFFESASEERQHAIKVIEYLLMRGQLTSDFQSSFKILQKPYREAWNDGVDALNNALALEANVTQSIREIIKTCETPEGEEYKKFNDYHLVDYLTGDFLDEQYKGERELAGKLSTLGKMMKEQGVLGEFLFDKKLLEGAV